MGVVLIEIIGWVEVLVYEVVMYCFVWVMSFCEKGVVIDVGQGVNYNIYVLGCEGYLSLNFVIDLKDLLVQKFEVCELFGVLEFDKGKCYEDFDLFIDYVVEYGLVVLVVGVGVKKFGLFVVVFVFIVKFVKIIFFVVVGVGVVVIKFFKCDKIFV